MKKNKAIAFIFSVQVLITSVLFAQNDADGKKKRERRLTFIGVKAAMDFTDYYEYISRWNTVRGLYLPVNAYTPKLSQGVAAEFKLGRGFTFLPEIMYCRRQFSSVSATDTYFIESETTVHNIKFSPTIRKNFEYGASIFSLMGGVNLDGYYWKSYDYKSYYNSNREISNYTSGFIRFSYNFSVGAGYSYQFKNQNKLQLDYRINTMPLRGCLSAGYLIKLK